MASTAYLVSLVLLAGCAARSTAPVGEEAAPLAAEKAGAPAARPAGIVLEYKMPAGRVLRYQDATEVREVTDVMGMTNESHSTLASSISFQAKGQKDQNHLIGVTIDDMSLTVTGPQGDLSPEMTPVKGRGFDMVLSPLGAEVDVSGAEAITYQFATGPRSVAPGFKVFFPDLPGKPVQIGDTWPSSFVIEDKSGATNMRVDAQSVNTLEGFETIDGMECARIASKNTGTISGTGNQQGLDLLFAGTLKGTDVWYFAVKEGIYVKSTSETVNEISITVSGPQTMTIPATQTRKSEVKLAGR
ncbi:MAG: hypothetical protein A2V76_08065 [Candidatus Aminicenantes bacterium RBG_16_63_14]|nr:MAG: hypothetical protein A2V76_08065 [Candidatus Aminicenantes bacterium RBG_16_63_14]OGD26255.1 MAG: hypothetical protein A2V57_09595 [Candidatus Aminicenantes bacterium RBG_19FT_COMBO_65_30]